MIINLQSSINNHQSSSFTSECCLSSTSQVTPSGTTFSDATYNSTCPLPPYRSLTQLPGQLLTRLLTQLLTQLPSQLLSELVARLLAELPTELPGQLVTQLPGELPGQLPGE